VSSERTEEDRSRYRSTSLSVRFVGLILLFVLVTGLLLGVPVSLVSLRNASEERHRGLEYAAAVVASSLIPVISDQDSERIRAQLQGLMAATTEYDIECSESADSAGVVSAETDEGCSCDDIAAGGPGFVASFTEPQVVRVPVEIEGLQVAEVSVQFRPEGLEQAEYEPLSASVIVLALAMIVVSLWGAWVVLRVLVEPIGEVRDAAADIAEGKREISVQGSRTDEIGDLAAALEDMTSQLETQERQLLDSYTTLEGAYQEKDELAQQLEHTMAAKSNFVAVASHELRSPLAVIQLYSEML